ncbi:MAG: hypothetical protein FJZ67_05780 [Bacteroidetes bacterium]|nr:hypothetical protein [Bacteroidota bacterium]
MTKFFFYFLFLMIILISCKKKEPQPQTVDNYLNITVQPTYKNNGAENALLDSIYTTPEGYKVKFTDVKFYVTKLKNGNSNLLESSFFDFRETGLLLARVKGDYSQFLSLQGYIGVDSVLNHSDPSAFPNDSPLNISNAGPMHWGWNPGYIFINLEGKVDTIPDGVNNLDHSFSFHIGTDAYRRNLNFSNVTWQTVSATEKVFPLKLDLWKFLHNPISPIDLKTQFLTHTASGQQALTLKVTSNFEQALTAY